VGHPPEGDNASYKQTRVSDAAGNRHSRRLALMMGQHDRSESLFYCFRIEVGLQAHNLSDG